MVDRNFMVETCMEDRPYRGCEMVVDLALLGKRDLAGIGYKALIDFVIRRCMKVSKRKCCERLVDLTPLDDRYRVDI